MDQETNRAAQWLSGQEFGEILELGVLGSDEFEEIETVIDDEIDIGDEGFEAVGLAMAFEI